MNGEVFSYLYNSKVELRNSGHCDREERPGDRHEEDVERVQEEELEIIGDLLEEVQALPEGRRHEGTASEPNRITNYPLRYGAHLPLAHSTSRLSDG